MEGGDGLGYKIGSFNLKNLGISSLGEHNERDLQKIAEMPPRLVMKKFDMTIIRPMCLVHEADLVELAA